MDYNMKFSQRFREKSTYMGYLKPVLDHKTCIKGVMQPIQILRFVYMNGMTIKRARAMGDVTYGLYVDPNSTVDKPWFDENDLSLHKIGLASSTNKFPKRMDTYRNRKSGTFEGLHTYQSSSQVIIDKHVEKYDGNVLIHVFAERQKTHTVEHWVESLNRYVHVPAKTVDDMEIILQDEATAQGEDLCYQVQGHQDVKKKKK